MNILLSSSDDHTGTMEAETGSPGITPALVALGLGGFGIGVGEFVPMGLLPEIAGSFDASLSDAGHIVSAYALGVVVGAPFIAIFGAKLPRRALLVSLMSAFAVGNVVSALAPSYETLIAARFLTGLPHGAFFGVAALLAASMAGPARRAWAISRVMLGLSIATVIGVPIATWLGQQLSWRAAFVAVALIAVATVLSMMRVLPVTGGSREATARRELAGLKRPQVWLTLAVGAVGLGGLFAVYAYISPTMTERAGLPEEFLPLVLAVWGLGSVIANLISGPLFDRWLVPSLFGILIAFAGLLAAFTVLSTNPVTATIGVFLLGLGFALGPGLQTRLMDVAGDAQTLAAALHHGAFNAANALGPFLAGLAIDRGADWSAPPWIGVGLAIGGLVIFSFSVILERMSPGRRKGELPASPDPTGA